MKVTVIIGEPCVGKSLLMKEFMRTVGNWNFESPPYVPHHVHLKNGKMSIVVGRYDDKNHKFPGTDRMSMACQPHMAHWLFLWQNAGIESVFIEGDRLGNAKFLKTLQYLVGEDLEVIHVFTPANFLTKRREEQRPDQNPTFVRSRRTKISNLLDYVAKRKIKMIAAQSINLADTHQAVAHMLKDRM